MSVLKLNKENNLLSEAAENHSLIFVQHFSSTILPTPTLPCLQMVPMGVSPLTVVLPAKSQSRFSLTSIHHQQDPEMAQHIAQVFAGHCHDCCQCLPHWLGCQHHRNDVLDRDCWEGHQPSWARVSYVLLFGR